MRPISTSSSRPSSRRSPSRLGSTPASSTSPNTPRSVRSSSDRWPSAPLRHPVQQHGPHHRHSPARTPQRPHGRPRHGRPCPNLTRLRVTTLCRGRRPWFRLSRRALGILTVQRPARRGACAARRPQAPALHPALHQLGFQTTVEARRLRARCALSPALFYARQVTKITNILSSQTQQARPDRSSLQASMSGISVHPDSVNIMYQMRVRKKVRIPVPSHSLSTLPTNNQSSIYFGLSFCPVLGWFPLPFVRQ